VGLPDLQEDLLLRLQDLREEPPALQGVSLQAEAGGAGSETQRCGGRCSQARECCSWSRVSVEGRRGGWQPRGRGRVMDEGERGLHEDSPRHFFEGKGKCRGSAVDKALGEGIL